MRMEIKPFTKYTFLIHFLIAVIFGVILLFIPEMYSDMTAWPQEPYMARISGAFFLAMATGSFLAFRETEWSRVEIYVLISIVLMILGAIASIWGMFIMTLPIIGWAYTGLWIFLLVLYLYVFFIQR